MRYTVVLLLCSMMLACGKTGALYLPEEEPEPAPAPTPAPAPQEEPATDAGTENSGNTD